MANGQKQNNRFDISFQRTFTNINSTTGFSTSGKKASRFSVENILSHSSEKIRRGTLLCFRKILVSKNARDKRGGVYHNFPSKFFCLTVPKNFVGKSFSDSLISGIEKFWIRGGRKYRIFPSKIFCHTVPKFP